MSEINEKMIQEVVELLKRVSNLEMKFNNSNQSSESILKNVTAIQQSIHDNITHNNMKQNDLYQNSINKVANEANAALQTISNRIEFLNRRFNEVPNFQNTNEEKINLLISKIEKIESFLASFGKKKEIEGTPLENLAFSTRIVNAFKSEKIKTVEDLIKLSSFEVRCIPNLAKKSLDEIIFVLESLGMKLND